VEYYREVVISIRKAGNILQKLLLWLTSCSNPQHKVRKFNIAAITSIFTNECLTWAFNGNRRWAEICVLFHKFKFSCHEVIVWESIILQNKLRCHQHLGKNFPMRSNTPSCLWWHVCTHEISLVMLIAGVAISQLLYRRYHGSTVVFSDMAARHHTNGAWNKYCWKMCYIFHLQLAAGLQSQCPFAVVTFPDFWL